MRLSLICGIVRNMSDATPIITALGRAGYRLTEPRRAVATLIADQAGHFTAAELVTAARDRRLGVGRATVFRTTRCRSRRSGPSSASTCRPASMPMSGARRHTTITSSARAVAGPSRSTTLGFGPSCARSPARPASASTSIGSSCSACARAARPADRDRPAQRLTAVETCRCSSDPPRSSVSSIRLAIDRHARAWRRAGSSGRRGPTRRRSRSWRRPPSSPTSSGNVGGDARRGHLDHPGRRRSRGLRAQAGRRPGLADADLIVSNGVGLDDFLDELIDAAGEDAVPRLILGEGIPTIDGRRRAEPALLARPEPRRRAITCRPSPRP